jgi:hypothetical protein
VNRQERQRLVEAVRLGDTGALWKLWRELERGAGVPGWRVGCLPSVSDFVGHIDAEYWSMDRFLGVEETLVCLVCSPTECRTWMLLLVHPDEDLTYRLMYPDDRLWRLQADGKLLWSRFYMIRNTDTRRESDWIAATMLEDIWNQIKQGRTGTPWPEVLDEHSGYVD